MTAFMFVVIITAMNWLWVTIFGVMGVSSRFAIDTFISRYALTFPVGTLLINIAGCFIAGFIFGLQKDLAANPVRLGMVVGFCGGFTTFSGFGLQFVQLASDGKLGAAAVYGLGTPTLCLFATAAGLFLSKTLIAS
jgi:fluoride exporter